MRQLRNFAKNSALTAIALVPWVGAASAGTFVLAGPIKQGALIQGRTDAGTRIEFDGRSVRVSDDGIFLIGFSRDAPRKARLRVTYADGTREWRTLKVQQRKYHIQRINGLPPRTINPTEDDLKRIRAESALIKKARRHNDARTDFLTGFAWPVKGRITGVYGSQRILNGEPRRPHFGLDIAAPEGALVVAPADGIVTLTHLDMFFSGGTLILDHGHGLSSTFIHLSGILVKEGDRVRQGDPIAKVGATGRAKGAHLDWRLNLFNRRLDPQLVLDAMPVKSSVSSK
ncbi:MAG: M23 family metallopeptidase [Acidiferrobacterales bacterium]